ncbi:octopamine receptor beta-1R-like [Patiria miniata]|uniref:G-protein coupled receptors family 1 profile domain-containing protein n=1 Tax=Patiria miniata TaxID=46514 RepID=A0A914AD56_PATMI|nr:octopamine receptor beta-1R-like [Patiria miniata]
MDDVNSTSESSQSDVPVNGHTVFLYVLYGIAFIVGTIGNSLVILAVLLSKKLRTTTNAFVVNLSVADLLTCLVLSVNVALGALDKRALMVSGRPWEWDGYGLGFILLTTLGCSIITLMCIALNRWLLITRPLTTYRNVYTPRKIAVYLVCAWVIPLVFTFIVVLRLMTRHVSVAFAIAMFPIPLILIIACYVLIWRRINRQVRSMACSSPTPEELTTHIPTKTQLDDNPGPSDSTQPRSQPALTTGNDQLSRHQVQITKNMCYVVCAFVLCVGPYAVFLCLQLINLKLKIGTEYAFTVLLCNSCINPLIYATKHRDFKTVFRCIVRRQWDDIPEPSDVLKALRRSKCCGRSNNA